MTRSLLRALPALAVAAGLGAQTTAALNMELESHLSYPPCTTADLWAFGDYALVARRGLGFTVIDLRVPGAPVQNTIAPPGYPDPSAVFGIGDIKTDARYYYVCSDLTPGAVYIYDAAVDPLYPSLVSVVVDQRTSGGVHNCWVAGDVLYAICTRTSRVELYDIHDRSAPRWIASLGVLRCTPSDLREEFPCTFRGRPDCSLGGAA